VKIDEMQHSSDFDLAGDLAAFDGPEFLRRWFFKVMLKNANVVGQNVVKFRHQAGWTQEELAAKIQLLGCYMTREIVANVETRRSAVTDKRIVIFAEVFCVEINHLFLQGSSKAKPNIFTGTVKSQPNELAHYRKNFKPG
jgi:transcriptional regulator with XRE-family HTH domain